MITIYEPPIRNSGIIGGKFLERTRIAKPGSSPDKPVFYGPDDMHIGSVIEIFNHRFVITNADEYVLKYMDEHPGQFSGNYNCENKKKHFRNFLLNSHKVKLATSLFYIRIICFNYTRELLLYNFKFM